MDAGETPTCRFHSSPSRSALDSLTIRSGESHTLKQTLESYSNKEITDHEFITALDDLTVETSS